MRKQPDLKKNPLWFDLYSVASILWGRFFRILVASFSHYLNFKRQDFEFEEFVIFKACLVFFFLPRKINDLIYPVLSKVPLTYLQGEKNVSAIIHCSHYLTIDHFLGPRKPFNGFMNFVLHILWYIAVISKNSVTPPNSRAT